MINFVAIIWCSLEECGRYLETIKVYENKPADLIQGQMDTDYLSRVSIFLLLKLQSMNKYTHYVIPDHYGFLLTNLQNPNLMCNRLFPLYLVQLI